VHAKMIEHVHNSIRFFDRIFRRIYTHEKLVVHLEGENEKKRETNLRRVSVFGISLLPNNLNEKLQNQPIESRILFAVTPVKATNVHIFGLVGNTLTHRWFLALK
jgi:hypothetical protein